MTTTALQITVHPAVEGGLHLEVTNVSPQTASIVSITLADPSGARLPSYVPGSHLVVQYGSGVNAYSLTGSGNGPSEYNISVLRVEDGLRRFRGHAPALQSATVCTCRVPAVLLPRHQQPPTIC